MSQPVCELSQRDFCWLPCGIDKKPLVPWKEFQTRKPTAEELAHWRQLQPAGWAVVTGRISGVFVLDFDGPAGAQTLKTLGLQPHIQTPSGGYHVYVELPAGVTVRTTNAKSDRLLGELYPSMDVRGEGGYAIAYGRNGEGEYKCLRELEPEPFDSLPYELREYLIGNPIPAKARLLLEKALANAVPGCRNDVGFGLARELRDNGVPETVARDILRKYASSVPQDKDFYTVGEALASLEQAYRREPRLQHGQVGANGGVVTKFVPRFFTEQILSQTTFYACGDKRSGDFYYYDATDGIWRNGAEAYITHLLRENDMLPTEWKREFYINEVVADVRGLVWQPNSLPEPDLNLIPFSNGVFELNTGSLRPYQPNDYFTTKLPWSYQPDAISTVLEKRVFAFPEHIRQHFFELLAYCLWRGYPFQRAFFWIGRGSNGKSFLATLLTKALGNENVAQVSLHQLTDDRFAASELHKRLLNVSGELSYQTIENAELLKSLTGNDYVLADRKYRDRIRFQNYAKLLFLGNGLPVSRDTTEAFFRRAFIVEFDHVFAENPAVVAELELLDSKAMQREFGWLLSRAVETLRTLQANNFVFSGDLVSVEARREKYLALASPLRRFLAETTEITRKANDCVFKHEFAERLSVWFRERGLNEPTPQQVNAQMRELGIGEARRGERKWWVWTGICWSQSTKSTRSTNEFKPSKKEGESRFVNAGIFGTSGTLTPVDPDKTASNPAEEHEVSVDEADWESLFEHEPKEDGEFSHQFTHTADEKTGSLLNEKTPCVEKTAGEKTELRKLPDEKTELRKLPDEKTPCLLNEKTEIEKTAVVEKTELSKHPAVEKTHLRKQDVEKTGPREVLEYVTALGGVTRTELIAAFSGKYSRATLDRYIAQLREEHKLRVEHDGHAKNKAILVSCEPSSLLNEKTDLSKLPGEKTDEKTGLSKQDVEKTANQFTQPVEKTGIEKIELSNPDQPAAELCSANTQTEYTDEADWESLFKHEPPADADEAETCELDPLAEHQTVKTVNDSKPENSRNVYKFGPRNLYNSLRVGETDTECGASAGNWGRLPGFVHNPVPTPTAGLPCPVSSPTAVQHKSDGRLTLVVVGGPAKDVTLPGNPRLGTHTGYVARSYLSGTSVFCPTVVTTLSQPTACGTSIGTAVNYWSEKQDGT